MTRGLRTGIGSLILALGVTPAFAHRLDEYLQGTILSVGKMQVQAQMTLTPGVAVLPIVIAAIDTDSDGLISGAEQRAYAERVLRDLTLTCDGHSLVPHLTSIQFPAMEEMKEGRGEIHLDFAADLPIDLPTGGANRKLSLENRHLGRVSVYQVNALVPADPDIRIASQNRNYSQSLYELDYVQTGDRPESAGASWPVRLAWLTPIGLLFLSGMAFRRYCTH